MHKWTLLIALALIAPARLLAQEPDHAIHEELRGLLRGIQSAVNEGKYDELPKYFHDKMRVTTINQEVISTPAEIPAYFNKWFGSGGFLKKVVMKLNADDLTELYGDKTWGIVRGSGEEDYSLADGRFFPMKTRWTATLAKDADGKWRVLTLHIGTNFLDNPILGKAETALAQFAAGGLTLGALIGGVIGFLVGRRRKAA
jgi:ketosteroid isomerase-like protein